MNARELPKETGRNSVGIQSEDRAPYNTSGDDAVIAQAIAIIDARLRRNPVALLSPKDVINFLRLSISEREHEVFVVLWLDAQNRLICYEELFRGTLTQASVYPREVVKSALAHNAAAVIMAHNHPSGVAEPSRADEALTVTLKQSLALVDVKLLDHIVIAADSAVSLAERGII